MIPANNLHKIPSANPPPCKQTNTQKAIILHVNTGKYLITTRTTLVRATRNQKASTTDKLVRNDCVNDSAFTTPTDRVFNTLKVASSLYNVVRTTIVSVRVKSVRSVPLLHSEKEK